MVGAGHSYTRAGIAIVPNMTQVMPSGGFVRMDQQKLAEDVQHGLVGLTRRQMGFVWRWSRAKETRNSRRVVAIGDIVPLLLAWLPTRIGGAPFAFIRLNQNITGVIAKGFSLRLNHPLAVRCFILGNAP